LPGVGAGPCSSVRGRLPAATHAVAYTDASAASPGSDQRTVSHAHLHAVSHEHTKTYPYTPSAADRHADRGASNRHASAHRDTISDPAHEHRHADSHPTDENAIPNGDAQAAYSDAYQRLSLSSGPSALARSLASLS